MSEEANEDCDPNRSGEFNNEGDAHRHTSYSEEVEGLDPRDTHDSHERQIWQLFASYLERARVSYEQKYQEREKDPRGADLRQSNRANSASDDEFCNDTGSSEEEGAENDKYFTGEFTHRLSVLESVFWQFHYRVVSLLNDGSIYRDMWQYILDEELRSSDFSLVEGLIFFASAS